MEKKGVAEAHQIELDSEASTAGQTSAGSFHISHLQHSTTSQPTLAAFGDDSALLAMADAP